MREYLFYQMARRSQMGSNYSASWKNPAPQVPTDLNDLPFPVWGTQGGGLARLEGNRYVWHEPPEWATDQPDMAVGDPIPEEWDLAAANHIARDVLEDDDRSIFSESDFPNIDRWTRPSRASRNTAKLRRGFAFMAYFTAAPTLTLSSTSSSLAPIWTVSPGLMSSSTICVASLSSM